LRDELSVPVEFVHRAFILREEDQEQHFTEYHLRHRRAARELTGLPIDLPRVGDPYPSSSLPALEAAEWVRQHRPDRFDGFDLALYEAFFRETRDISSSEVLAELAEQAGIPGGELSEAVRDRRMREAVWSHYREALERGVRSIPTVVIGDEVISGAVPYVEYAAAGRKALRL
jgi:predicted DsbA family dithiol-disulfide isomerase